MFKNLKPNQLSTYAIWPSFYGSTRYLPHSLPPATMIPYICHLRCTPCFHALLVTPPSHSTLCSTLYTVQVPHVTLQSLYFIPVVYIFLPNGSFAIPPRFSISSFNLDIRSRYSMHCIYHYTRGGYWVKCYHVEKILTELPLPPILHSLHL